ncbi:hypothetical protein CB1_000303001 [Camelus ferus]|nr:hypothetical protein CB1_000303001 [Camelus ferus]
MLRFESTSDSDPVPLPFHQSSASLKCSVTSESLLSIFVDSMTDPRADCLADAGGHVGWYSGVGTGYSGRASAELSGAPLNRIDIPQAPPQILLASSVSGPSSTWQLWTLCDSTNQHPAISSRLRRSPPHRVKDHVRQTG